MLRKIVFVLVALALPLLAATAVGAQQYPPTGDGPAPSTAVVEETGDAGGAPLPSTGTDVALLAGVAGVLVVGGAAAVVVARRRVAVATVRT